MREEYNRVLSTPAEIDKIGRFGRYRYIDKTQISARYIGQAVYQCISEHSLENCLQYISIQTALTTN